VLFACVRCRVIRMSCKCVVMLVCRSSMSCDIRESFRYVMCCRQVVQLRVLGCEYAEGNTERTEVGRTQEGYIRSATGLTRNHELISHERIGRRNV
jgi:hypothetical protein